MFLRGARRVRVACSARARDGAVRESRFLPPRRFVFRVCGAQSVGTIHARLVFQTALMVFARVRGGAIERDGVPSAGSDLVQEPEAAFAGMFFSRFLGRLKKR